MFLKLFEAGLAYRKAAPVKWCPNDQTVLANEQVIDGHCERCGAEVESRNLEQWMFRITDYADRLLDEMALLESWPERVLTMQRNWIGRSEGAEVAFEVEGLGERVDVFTTRPDTLFGATFFVVAPEHPLVERFAARSAEGATLRAYVNHAATLKSEERAAAVEKTGVFTGFYAINPVNDARIPIWVADYVLMDYGTGAIMAVPAHDERDFAFAERFGAPGHSGRRPPGGEPVRVGPTSPTPTATLMQLWPVQRADVPGGQTAIVAWLEDDGRGARRSTIVCATGFFHGNATGAARSRSSTARAAGSFPCRDDLPVLLPEIDDYLPKGRSPLAAAEDWVATPCPSCGGPARRETDTMDTFVDSSWYFLRYTDPATSAPFAASSSTTGCRSTSTSAGSSTRSSTYVRPLLHQGALRPRAGRVPRTVRPPLQPGHDLPLRREDVEVEGQRRLRPTSSSGASARMPCASTSSSWGRPTRTRSGRTRGSRGCGAS